MTAPPAIWTPWRGKSRCTWRGTGAGVPVSQLHFGGGTPTFLSDEELTGLMGDLRRAFRFGARCRDLHRGGSAHGHARTPGPLRTLGFNRLSFGVQDFDPRVQVAVHRVHRSRRCGRWCRARGRWATPRSTWILIYGLPLQTTESFACTISQIALRPDRIALYAYAHLPERFKPQRRINEADLPDRATRVGLLRRGHRGVQAWLCLHRHGPFRAAFRFRWRRQQRGELHRNFQGYSTQPDRDLAALGVSAIGRIGNTYSQNVKTLDAYYEAIEPRFATERGLELSPDDLVRREIIMDIMCQGDVDFAQVEARHGLRFGDYRPRTSQLANLAESASWSTQPAACR